MMYPGYDIARQISGQPVLFDIIVDEDITPTILDYDIAWGDEEYNAVFIELANCQSTGDGNALYMQMSADNGATFDGGASDYRFRNLSWGSGVTNLAGPLGLIGLSTNSGNGSAANETQDYSIIIPSPADANRKTAIALGRHVFTNGNPVTNQSYGYRNAAQIVNAVRFKTTGGATWVSGHARAFGLRRP